MGVLKILASKNSCPNAQNYSERNDRAAKKTCLNIDNPKQWAEEMEATKRAWGKTDGVQNYQIVDAYEREEGKEHYNVHDIHAAGVRKAKLFAELGYQVTVITHADTDHIHNHIYINSVNAENGKKLRISKAKSESYHNKNVDVYARDLIRLNDEICRELNLHTLSESKSIKDQKERKKGIQPENRKTDEIYLEQKGKSYKATMRAKLQKIWADNSIMSPADFSEKLKEEKLVISRKTSTGNITYQDQEGHKVRAKNLGAFNEDDVYDLIKRNQRAKQKEVKSNELNRRAAEEELVRKCPSRQERVRRGRGMSR